MFDMVLQQFEKVFTAKHDAPGAGGDAAKKAPPPPKPEAFATDLDKGGAGDFQEAYAGYAADAGSDAFGHGAGLPGPLTHAGIPAHLLDRRTMNEEQKKKPEFHGLDKESMRSSDLESRQKAAGAIDPTLRYMDGTAIEARMEGREAEYLKKWNAEHPDATEEEKSGIKIGANESRLPLSHKTDVGEIDTAAGRMRALNMLTQNRDPSDPNYKATDKVSCAPATVVAGVLYSEGKKGLSTLLAAVQNPNDPDQAKLVESLKAKLDGSGDLSVGDLQNLQDMVYSKMKYGMEGADPKEMAKAAASTDPKEQAQAFVKTGTMKEFMEQNPKIKKMFEDNKLDIANIDVTGDGKGEHAILRIGTEEGHAVAYYDPWKKRGEVGQIINVFDGDKRKGGVDEVSMEDYANAGAEDPGKRMGYDKGLDNRG
jgi:hypothetical protein